MKGLKLEQKRKIIGWMFLVPAVGISIWMRFYPMIEAFVLSFQTSKSGKMIWSGIHNFYRITKDTTFWQCMFNTVFYLVVQVPIMLIFALILASCLNRADLKLKRVFRTCIFLPCAVSLVSYSIIFKSLFANNGLINNILRNIGLPSVGWFSSAWPARIIIVIALIWRWTGYNMIFYLAGLQNIETSIYEAAEIDGANAFTKFTKITVPLLKPTIIMTVIMSTTSTLQLFDESVNLTNGGPGRTTMTISHYIYNTCFGVNSNLGYASAMSFVVMFIIVILSIIQLKAGDKR